MFKPERFKVLIGCRRLGSLIANDPHYNNMNLEVVLI